VVFCQEGWLAIGLLLGWSGFVLVLSIAVAGAADCIGAERFCGGTVYEGDVGKDAKAGLLTGLRLLCRRYQVHWPGRWLGQRHVARCAI
jgi:hypothetical protein